MKSFAENVRIDNVIEEILKKSLVPLPLSKICAHPEVAAFGLTDGAIRLRLMQMRDSKIKRAAQIPFSDPDNAMVRVAFVHASHPEAIGKEHAQPSRTKHEKRADLGLDQKIIDFIRDIFKDHGRVGIITPETVIWIDRVSSDRLRDF